MLLFWGRKSRPSLVERGYPGAIAKHHLGINVCWTSDICQQSRALPRLPLPTKIRQNLDHGLSLT